MLIKDKTTQKEIIKSQFENIGWKVSKLKVSEWWENEVWKLESVWSPTGKEVFVIFENDSMNYDDKILEPWRVIVSSIRPTNHNGQPNDFGVVLNKKWQQELPKLIEHLSKIRNE